MGGLGTGFGFGGFEVLGLFVNFERVAMGFSLSGARFAFRFRMFKDIELGVSFRFSRSFSFDRCLICVDNVLAK